MSMLQGVKGGGYIDTSVNCKLLDRYASVEEYYRMMLTMSILTDLSTVWHGSPDTCELYIGCWNRNKKWVMFK